MLNDSRIKVYVNAYITRLSRGESLSSIDEDYINMKRLTKKETEEIHKKLNLNYKV